MVNTNAEYYPMFLETIQDLIEIPEVKKLDHCSHHYRSTRLEHCVNVSYYSFLICRRFGWDYRSAARGGLLHDLFYYECKNVGIGTWKHFYLHPRFALHRAEKICTLNAIERDIIAKHMFIPCLRPPKYKESAVVCLVDKMCATYEAGEGIAELLKMKFAFR